jgi:hypothetical protein
MVDSNITYKHGFFFPIGGLIFGGFILFAALSIMLNAGNIIAFCIGMAVAGLGLLFFSKKGLDINKEKRTIHPYTIVLGIKTGKYLQLSDFKFISIINQTYRQSSFSRSGTEIKSEFGTFNILLINDTHHLKQFVESFSSYESALQESEKLATALNFEIVKYNPVRTRGRKK